MQQIIFIQQNYRKLLIGETKSCLCLKTANKVIKKPSKKQDSSFDENLFIIYLLMLEDTSIKWWRVHSLTELDVIMTTDISLLKGCANTLQHQRQSRLFPWIRSSHDLILSFHWHQCGGTRAWICPTILQIIKDHKEGKTVCYRQLIDHTIAEIGVLCLHLLLYLDDQDLIRIQRGEYYILLLFENELRCRLA